MQRTQNRPKTKKNFERTNVEDLYYLFQGLLQSYSTQDTNPGKQIDRTENKECSNKPTYI